MKVPIAHLRERAQNGGGINFAVFDARSSSGVKDGNSALLAQLTMQAWAANLRIDQSALAYASGGRTQFFGNVRLVAGVVTGLFLANKEAKASPVTLKPFLSGAAAAFFTNLPDILEPATSPNHRAFFHSLAFAGVLGIALNEVRQWEPQTDWDKFFRHLILVAGSAYLIHLALDFTTRKSLPLIGPF